MDKPLSQETQSQIRALCESIAHREQLGEDVQEELRGHIEDKIVGYLEGREAISEQDAVILAREHFGDPFTIKTLLNTAHPGRAYAGLGRRIAVVFLATLLAQSAFRVVSGIVLAIQASTALKIDSLFLFLYCGYEIGLPLVLYGMLRTARSNAGEGWIGKLVTAPLYKFRFITLMTFILWFSLPSVYPMSITQVFISTPYAFPFTRAVSILGAAMTCFVWIWWCDQRPRTFAAIRSAAVAWAIVTTLFSLITQMAIFVAAPFLRVDADLEPTRSASRGLEIFFHLSYQAQFVTSFLVSSGIAAVMVYLYHWAYRTTRNEIRYE